MKTIRGLVLLVVSMVLIESASARQLSLVATGGLSKDMRSQTSNRWNMGFNVGAQGFLSVPGLLTFGGRVGYHSRSIDGDGWVKDVFTSQSNVKLKSAAGSQTIIELAPSMRFNFTPGISPVKVGLQVGAGLFMVSEADIKFTASYSSPGVTGEITQQYSSSSLTGFGLELGLPVTIAGRVELFPQYSVYNGSGDWYNYFILNVGIVIL
jgi:hypothetical protein